MDPSAPDWAKYISAEMKALLDRMDRRDAEWRKRDEEWRKRDEEWRREQKQRDEEWRREQKQRDEEWRREQKQRDEQWQEECRRNEEARRHERKEWKRHEVVRDGILREGLREIALHFDQRAEAREARLEKRLERSFNEIKVLLNEIIRMLRPGRNGYGRKPSRN